jgi:hypothetical protein
MVAAKWEQRRKRDADDAVAVMADALEHPFTCPGDRCGRACRSRAGLKTHMRACRHVDPNKLAAGGYEHAMLPGGVPSG